jgi:hypothetical protein
MDSTFIAFRSSKLRASSRSLGRPANAVVELVIRGGNSARRSSGRARTREKPNVRRSSRLARLTARRECHAPNSAPLLGARVNLISAEPAARGRVFGQIHVMLVAGHLHARARGEPPIDRSRDPGVGPNSRPTLRFTPELRVAQCIIDV